MYRLEEQRRCVVNGGAVAENYLLALCLDSLTQ